MISALRRALRDLAAPPLRRVVWLALTLSVASLVLLSLVTALALDHVALFGWRPLNWIVDLLGAFAVGVLSWLLFPAVVTMVLGFFLDRIADVVEKLDYPGLEPPRRIPLREMLGTTMRLMGIAILVNLLALPAYVLIPGLNLFVFLGVNGYLFGREYFEVVALRRLDPAAAQAVRRRFAWRVLSAGVVITGLFAVPIVNLVVPVIATALMVHLFEGLRPAAQSSAA